MIQLFSEGAYLVDGTTLVKESEAEALKPVSYTHLDVYKRQAESDTVK